MVGSLEVITGPMFSGKTEELIRRVRRAEIAEQSIAIYKPQIDDRYSNNMISSHTGATMIAEPIPIAFDALRLGHYQKDVIAFDEAQFFDDTIVNVIDIMMNYSRVIVSGLDRDFRGKPFGFMPTLLAMADKVDKLTAICAKCKREATMTQRLVNGEPAHLNDEVVIIGGVEKYEARCRNCLKIKL